MPLFKCDKCGTVENTALTACSWGNHAEGKPVLCSECCSGKWHGIFPKTTELSNGEEDFFKSLTK